MCTRLFVGILVLLALALPASPANAGGVVTVCDEAHLRSALAGGGTVTFACSGTITLTAEIVIAADTTIDGSGQSVTISGNRAVRVFWVNSGVMLNLDNITVLGGDAVSGAGTYNDGGTVTVSNSTFAGNHAYDLGGGGIDNDHGTVTISNSTFSGNSAVGWGGGVSNYGGTLTVSNSTFSGNGASFSDGGGIDNWRGTATISNSTFAGNSAASSYGEGGGIACYESELTVSNSTFAGNSAGYGGGISKNGGTLTVSNSTFSGNSASDGGTIYSSPDSAIATVSNSIVENCSGPITDGGGNLSFPGTTCPGINADPVLGSLQNNGGPTWTMALLPGSAAIDAGDDAICAAAPVNNLDQRGVTRPQGAHCDIGAVEQVVIRQTWLPTLLVR